LSDGNKRSWAISREKYLRVTAYVSFGILCFLFFSYLTFPYKRVADIMIAKLESRVPFGFQVSDVDPSFIPGISLRDVKVFPGSASEGAAGANPPARKVPLLEIDRLRLRLKFLSFLRGGIGFSFDSRFALGRMKGKYFRSPKKFRIESTWEGIKLEQVNYLKARHGLNLFGSLSGGVEVGGDTADVRTAKGAIVFQVGGGGVQNATLMKVITLPDMEFERFGGKFVFKEGKVIFDQVEMKGKDLQAEFTGDVSLRKPFGNSVISLNLRFKPSLEVDNQIGYIFTTAQMRKDPQGFYTRRISGTFNNPR